MFSAISREIKSSPSALKTLCCSQEGLSGGISAGSMIACCAHHLSDILPLIGVAGLSAFLVESQFFFIILGVMSNIVGITIMLETIQRYNLCPWVARLHVDMSRVKKGTMISAGLITVVAIAVFVFTQ